MEKSNGTSKKAVHKAAVGKDALTAKKPSATGDIAKKKPVAEKAEAPAKKATPKAAQSEDAVAAKAAPAKGDSTKNQAVADTGKKAKGAFAKKMEDVKSTATVIGHKIAEVAKDANKKTETFEDAVATGLHEMKKDIHQLAVNVAEKTKE